MVYQFNQFISISFLQSYLGEAVVLCRTVDATVTKIHVWAAGQEIASADANLSGDHSGRIDQANSWQFQSTPIGRWGGLGLSVDVMFDSETGNGAVSFIGAGIRIDYQLGFMRPRP